MKKSRLGLRIFLSVITTIVMFMLTINVIPPSKVVDYNPFLKQGEKLPMVAAHRGGATTNPQNTMKAFKSIRIRIPPVFSLILFICFIQISMILSPSPYSLRSH